MRLRAALGALLTILLQSASAVAASVNGALVAAETKTPLAAVEVVLRRAADSTVVAHVVTGADGRFRLDSLRSDHYLLRASLLGRVPFVRWDVVLTEGAPDLDLGTIALAVAPISIRGVDVGTARATAIVAPDRNIYLTKDMPAATSGTATDILRTVPELDVDIDGNVSLRGSTSVNIQFDGRAAPLKGQALTTFLRQMPASRIERVEVIANPSAKFDPEGTAGIVNLVLKDKLGLGLSGSVSLSLGQRFSSSGTRVAWQTGPLTVFGGVSGSLYHYSYESSTVRQSLLTSPPSAFAWNLDSRYAGRYGMSDVSADYALSKRSTLYGTINGTYGTSEPHTLTRYALSDSTEALTGSYERTDDGHWGSPTLSCTLGLQHVVQQGKDERSVEFMQNGTDGDNRSDGVQHTVVPAGAGDQASRQVGASGYHERSLQLDDTHPLGARGNLELGYRGAERRTTTSSDLRFFAGDSLVVTPLSDASDYAHREVFHSGYVTVGTTFGRLSLQGGVRAELARTNFDVRSSGHPYANDYRSLFPSANAAWDFGRGRTVRATYSKRIERPSPYQLNPDVPSSDSLNRFVGNPYLGPRYTHSWSLDASWTGSRGSLRLSPYLRRTVDNWDVVTHVDATGAATATFLNASSVRVFGASVTASLRQTGRIGGTLSVGVSQEHHDASNLSSQYRHEVTGWSANGNATFKTTSTLDLQAYLRYSPARALAQGRASAYTAFSLNARQKLGEKAWISLMVNDPFNLSTYWSSTGDATYAQRITSRNHMRSVSGSFTWTWGKAPETKQRRQSAEQPQQGSPGPGP